MKTRLIAIAAVLLPALSHGATVFSLNAEAFENDAAIRFWFHRDGGTDSVQSVDYVTRDGTALAGVQYVASTGTVTFAEGQTVVSVDVRLLDNGLLDGEKYFEILPSNPTPGLSIAYNDGWNCNPYWRGAIRDNELPPTRVNPLFVPEQGPGVDLASLGRFAAPMPDGRVLISGGPRGITMLKSNGWIDPDFRPGDDTVSGPFDPLHVFKDGKILTTQPLVYLEQRFVRLRPSGAVDAAFPICTSTLSNPCPRFMAAEADGKILIFSRSCWLSNTYAVYYTGILQRLNPNGALDAGFNQGVPTESIGEVIEAVAIQSDGKILVGGYRSPNDAVRPRLVRLNPDGSLDNTFLHFDGSIRKVLVRASGKILVHFGDITTGDERLWQLNEDGSIDSTFSLAAGLGFPHWLVEQPDGHILTGGYASLIRLNSDGSQDTNFVLDAHLVPFPCQLGITGEPGPAVTASGQILFGGRFDQVDGYPRPGLVRLFDSVPQREFRVLTPAEFYGSAGVAQIQVVRTGETAGPASVDFLTRDGTGKAGQEYLPQSGTLNFAPLEVSKTITVPLLVETGFEDRMVFYLELQNPSAGYTNSVPIPIVIRLQPSAAPRIRLIGSDILNGATLRFFAPSNNTYRVWVSTNLLDWNVLGPAIQTTPSRFEFHDPQTNQPRRFYRVSTP